MERHDVFFHFFATYICVPVAIIAVLSFISYYATKFRLQTANRAETKV